MQCTDVLARWASAGTALSCVAELRPGPAMIRMPSCRLGDSRLTCGDSAVVLEPWEEDAVETDWRGTKVELTYAHGRVVIADY